MSILGNGSTLTTSAYRYTQFKIMTWLGLCLFVILVTFAAPAFATNHTDRDWSSGPVSGDDFQAEPPETRPKASDGSDIKAAISTGIAVRDESYSSSAKIVDGKIVAETTAAVPKVAAIMEKDKSWIDPASKNDKQLIDHEQGHLDGSEKNARELQASYNKMKEKGELTLKKEFPLGTKKEDIDKELQRQNSELNKKIGDAYDKANAKDQAEGDKYDKDTDHGIKKDAQKKQRKLQRDALKSPNTDKKKKKGADAESKTSNSIFFDAATGRLTISQDIIVGIDPRDSGFVASEEDPALGAEVSLPEFSLVGQEEDGIFFFSADGDTPQLLISDGDTLLFETTFDYLMYDPGINLFYGLGRDFDAPGDSDFIAHLVDELAGSPSTLKSLGVGPLSLALLGIEFSPDENFGELTAEFSVDGTSAATNHLGARDVSPIPLPAALPLFITGLLYIGLVARQRRRPAAE